MKLRAALLCLFAAPLASEPPAPDIVVQGRRQDETRRFVEQAAPPDRGRQLARWNGPICPEVLNLHPAQARFLMGRIEAAARPLHVPVATRCTPDIRILFAADADVYAAALVKAYPRLGRDEDDGRAAGDQVAAMLAPRAVRWFAASRTVMGDGRPMPERVNALWSVSRIQQSTREDLASVTIVVDVARLAGVTWTQLGDYLAFVALARPDLAARYDAGTILSIFADGRTAADRPPELTAVDRDFLRALYVTDPRRSAEAQRSDIAARIEHPRR